MWLLGVDVGPARLPNANLTAEQRTQPHKSLQRLGLCEWIQ
jgi:hypothetical protein